MEQKKPIEQVIEWLQDGKVSFTDIAVIYTKLLEKSHIKHLAQATELATIATILRDGNKQQRKGIDQRYAHAVIDLGIFKGTPYESELKELL